jgi:hypothetical protein
MPVLQSLPTEIGALKNGSFVMLLYDPNDKVKAELNTFKTLLKNPEAKGIYICAAQPYEDIKRSLENLNINPFRFFFLDLTEQTFEKREQIVNLVSIGTDSNLTEISILITQIVQLMPAVSFIFIDSFMHLIDANGYETATSFVNLLKYICERLQFSCYAMMPEESYEDPRLVDIIENSTKIVYVGEPK